MFQIPHFWKTKYIKNFVTAQNFYRVAYVKYAMYAQIELKYYPLL